MEKGKTNSYLLSFVVSYNWKDRYWGRKHFYVSILIQNKFISLEWNLIYNCSYTYTIIAIESIAINADIELGYFTIMKNTTS